MLKYGENGCLHYVKTLNVCDELLFGSCPYQNNQILTHRGSFPVEGLPGTSSDIFLEYYNGKDWYYCTQIGFLLI